MTVCAAPVFGHQVQLGELALDVVGIGARLVDLVDRHDDRHVGRLGVVDRFARLRHDAVVGRDDEDDDVGDLGAAGAHQGERFVAGRVEEDDAAAVADVDVIRADVLRDAAGFALGDLGLADGVEQRRLAVVDVAHDRDDRRARPMSSGFDSSPSAETSSCSKLRISISAPNSRAMSLAVSMSSVLLMVIIMRFINSLASTSFTRTSSLSARSFTVMPSASVMVRVIGGGAAGADGHRAPTAARAGSARARLTHGPLLSERRTLPEAVETLPGRAGHARARHALAAACGPAATAADADHRACPASSDAAVSTAAAAVLAHRPGRRRRRASRRALPALRVAPAAVRRGGWTMRGCDTCGRFAGVSGRAGCGVLPGSSMRKPNRRRDESSRWCRWRRNRRGGSDGRGRLFDRSPRQPVVLRSAHRLRRQRTWAPQHARSRRTPRRAQAPEALFRDRPGRAGAGVRPVAGVAGLAPAAGGAGGCTMRGCVTCGRFAGASGRAGCGVLPGSSMRSRIVGGTNRPEGADGGATDAAAAICPAVLEVERSSLLRRHTRTAGKTQGKAAEKA